MSKAKLWRAMTASFALAMAPVLCLAADEQQSLEELRNTVINLLQALVDQGVMTREKAAQLVKAAQDKAAADAAAVAKSRPGSGARAVRAADRQGRDREAGRRPGEARRGGGRGQGGQGREMGHPRRSRGLAHPHADLGQCHAARGGRDLRQGQRPELLSELLRHQSGRRNLGGGSQRVRGRERRPGALSRPRASRGGFGHHRFGHGGGAAGHRQYLGPRVRDADPGRDGAVRVRTGRALHPAR